MCLDDVPDCLSATVPSALRVRRAAVLREHGQVQAQTGTSTRTYRTALTHLTASTASAASTAARARGARISPRFRQGKAANHKPTPAGARRKRAIRGLHWPPLARHWPALAWFRPSGRDSQRVVEIQPVFEWMQYTHKRSSSRRCTPHRHATSAHTNTGPQAWLKPGRRAQTTRNPRSTSAPRWTNHSPAVVALALFPSWPSCLPRLLCEWQRAMTPRARHRRCIPRYQSSSAVQPLSPRHLYGTCGASGLLM